MKYMYIYGYDTEEPRDFAVRVSEKVYKAMKQYLVEYHLKHPQEVVFIEKREDEEW